ncbi:DUF6801 domain-containing protein [Actinomadura sp. GTD37]|uniref:DUF6801 domain-containing protein n=1 Tax=Actinomadura sp. GTD37 TaxID=1778030 RepID=UPI0035BFB827
MSVRTRRAGRLLVTAGAGALLAAGLTGAGAAAADGRDADLTLSYQCAFPAGPQPVSVRYRAAFPVSAPPGAEVRPGAVAVTLSVPRAAVAGLDAAEVAGTVLVSAATGQNGTSSDAGWPALAVPPAAVPDEGAVTLTASGDVPPVTAGPTGDVTFSVGDLSLGLAPAEAAAATPEGQAATPLEGQVACTAVPGQDQVLATVPLSPPGAGEAPPKPPEKRAAPPAGQAPPDCRVLQEDGWQFSGCLYMNGFSNVRKLGGAAVLNDPAAPEPALTNVMYNLVPGPTGLGVDVRFRFHEPLRSNATFLTFDFMPTTATMEIDQVGLGTQTAAPYEKGKTRQQVQSKMRLSIRLYDVAVNGTPLEVGDHCRSVRPVDVALTDAPGADITNIVKGGASDGTFEIPPFEGCGVGEDLDPLFTGSVSGPGNYLKITQGAICGLAAATCPPAVPELKR